MEKIKGVLELVHLAIDKGATTVEEIHKAIANEPLNILEKVSGLEKTTDSLKNIQNHSIGNVYQTIRMINEEVSKVGQTILEKMDNDKKE